MESNEDNDDKMPVPDQQPSKDVKSTAVVKYDIMDHPLSFLQLQVNTNLNKPPANWLRSSSRLEQYIGQASQPKDRSRFNSFTMANNYPDMVGEVDVITDAENIKKLMKIPYSKSHVSMMVHRVGNTLLLDEFDVHKHLLRQQKDDWQWLRKFYYETVLESMQNDKSFLRKNKRRDNLQNRNMFSKFLYYSVGDKDDPEKDIEPLDYEEENDTLSGPERSEYQRTLLWTFEDIQMMLGTDLPIFGGGTHPCVSLRLRDMRKPISVLTGLDYWLDNLMCNVPELAMCFHLSGIVQNYELIKTEDIPNMDNSKFSPNVIRDLAQNILSFLKSNATKEGHTYWLFKGHDDDIVKLYDLTTLCSDIKENKNENPFTIPVGMLLYRVAMNIWAQQGRKKSGTVRTLLKNSLLLLDERQHSQIVTSANFLLAEVYVKDDIYQQTLSDESESESETDDNDDAENDNSEGLKPETSVNVRTLCHPDTLEKKVIAPYPPISGDVEERCKEALKHIAMALTCLDEDVKNPVKEPEEEQKESKHFHPNEAIPLHYEPLRQNRPKESTPAEPDITNDPSNPLALAQSCHTPIHTWHHTSKVHLLYKAALVYYWLADSRMKLLKFGRALRLVKTGLICFEALKSMSPARGEQNQSLLAALLGMAGDAHVMIARENKNIELHKELFNYASEQDSAVICSAQKDTRDYEAGFQMVSDFTCASEQNLVRGCQCYEAALGLFNKMEGDASRKANIIKRYGNVRNELGVHYMNQAAALAQEKGSGDACPWKDLWTQSFSSFQSGIQAFEMINDTINIALLYSNQGRLMRICAQTSVDYIDGKRNEFSGQEKMYYTKAVDYYQDALQSLHSRNHSQPEVWDSITWDLSSTYFTMATLMQDYAPLSSQSQEQVEKDVTDLMLKALKYCDVDTPTMKQPSYQYRAATIHYRLASLYHNAFRNQSNDQKKKHLKTLAELHYGKAGRFYLIVESPCELLRVQLEKVAMTEFVLNNQTSPNSKQRTLLSALQHVISCQKAFELVRQQCDDNTDDLASYEEELQKLLTIYESRLQFILLNLVRITSSLKKSKTTELHLANYKKMYATSLRKVEPLADSSNQTTIHQHCNHLSAITDDIKDIYVIIDPGYRSSLT
ncbi:erythroid differentiation-related factor 1-like [Lineus longissimus]|uniref:erythroid differentiation-related factor 1-like n=1 Tax=Lineus longissimus TaxID=88925 RepID=UPI002B4D090E